VDRVTLYEERAPLRGAGALVRTVWVQGTGPRSTLQRHLPTGGFELLFPLGSTPRLVGPLTRARHEVMPAGLTVVGARFWPGAAVPLLGVPADAVVDHVGPLAEISGRWSELTTQLARATETRSALALLQTDLLRRVTQAPPPDPVVAAAVRRLMPWRRTGVRPLTRELSISESQLRRRFRRAVGLGPKALQQVLRFQGYLALAQSAEHRRRVADLAAEVGYADHAHLSRECLRLTGRTPSQLLGEARDGCGCGHDHAASYRPFLAGRAVASAPRGPQ
jgi:AraC-like DNA-binding protein